MSRTPHPTRRPAAGWKLALPIVALALSAAAWSEAGAADAHAQPKAQHASFNDARDQPYALVRDGDHGVNMMMGSSDDQPSIKQARAHVKGDFLWFREDGRAYVIQDPDTLARARAAWAPVDRLGEQMDAYGRDMDKQGRAMDALGEQMGQAAAGIKPDAAKMHALERQMDELGSKMGSLGEQMAFAKDGERERLSREMGQLSARMGELGRQMGAAAHADGQRQAQATMEQVGRRMNEAGKPMDELGRKMKALGKDMERESHGADRTVRGLIHDAMARGLAQPLPQG